MTTDRAGPKGPSTERRVEARPGIFGFFYPVIVDAPLPWQAPFSALQAILDSAGPWELTHDNGLIPETPAKPVGSVSSPPDSSS